MADLLVEVVERCACEVSVIVNEHRNYYQSAEEWLNERGDEEGIEPDVRAEMIARNCIVQVQAYPQTPIGFYRVVHWDLVGALQRIVDLLRVDLANRLDRRERMNA